MTGPGTIIREPPRPCSWVGGGFQGAPLVSPEAGRVCTPRTVVPEHGILELCLVPHCWSLPTAWSSRGGRHHFQVGKLRLRDTSNPPEIPHLELGLKRRSVSHPPGPHSSFKMQGTKTPSQLMQASPAAQRDPSQLGRYGTDGFSCLPPAPWRRPGTGRGAGGQTPAPASGSRAQPGRDSTSGSRLVLEITTVCISSASHCRLLRTNPRKSLSRACWENRRSMAVPQTPSLPPSFPLPRSFSLSLSSLTPPLFLSFILSASL